MGEGRTSKGCLWMPYPRLAMNVLMDDIQCCLYLYLRCARETALPPLSFLGMLFVLYDGGF